MCQDKTDQGASTPDSAKLPDTQAGEIRLGRMTRLTRYTEERETLINRIGKITAIINKLKNDRRLSNAVDEIDHFDGW